MSPSKPKARTLTLTLSEGDYADVVRVLSVKEAGRPETNLPPPTNGQLFADACREWEQWNRTKEVIPAPPCPACGNATAADARGYACLACGTVTPATDFVPLRMFVTPRQFGELQALRQRVDARDVADLTNVAWSVYAGLVAVEKDGGLVFVQQKGRQQRLNLYPHKAPARGE